MSRSNGSQPQSAGHAPQTSGYDVNPDPRAWNPRQPAPAPQAAVQNPAAPQYQQRPVQQPAGQQQYAAPQPAQSGYADPYAQHGGYYQAPAATPQTAGRAAQPLNSGASYAPAFDPYVPAQTYQPAAYQPQQSAPVAASPAPSYPDLRGSTYDQWAAHQQPQQHDPRGYDLANYGSAEQQQGYAPARSAQIVAQQPSRTAEWPQAQTQAQYAQQGYDAYQQQTDAQLHAAAHDQVQSQGYDENYADAAGEGMEEETPQGRRGMLIAATLAGAIFVGGGLTYAYNSLLGSGASGIPPLVKSASGPTKVKPSEPGGKQFDHADSKVLGRLNDNGTAVASSGGTDAAGSKKVSTLVVKPDGTIEAPAPSDAAAAPEPAASSPSSAVPGMSVVSVGGTPAPAVAPEAKPAAQMAEAAQKPLVVNPPAAAAPAAAPAPAKVISQAAAAAPAIASLVETAAVAPATAAPAVKKPAAAVVKKAAVTTAAAAPAAVPTTGTGYMAVIASVPASDKSRMNALTQWADMQQKYGSILQSKTMDVQEANLGEKGTYHRLLVGPPGSKDSANTVCSQLKAAGHPDCWVMAF